jgi:hypothetical protein
MFAAFELMTLLLFGLGAVLPEAAEAEKVEQLNSRAAEISPTPPYTISNTFSNERFRFFEFVT